jgi:protein phosphatase
MASLCSGTGHAVDNLSGPDDVPERSRPRPLHLRRGEALLHFRYGAASHVGLVREHNEDAGFAGPYLQLVADGVGGAAAGEVASATTTYVVTALAMGRPDVDGPTLLAEAVATAHRELQRGTEADDRRQGMATTLTAVLVRDDRVTLVHVGDSRAYLLRGGELARLSTDQTLVQLLVDRGDLRPDQVATHPFRNVVLRSVNGDEPVEPALEELDLTVGDRVLLCSDGLTDFVPEAEIVGALGSVDPDEAAASLVDLALAAGGRDNVTCLVADLRDGPELETRGLVLGAMQDPTLVVDPGAISASGP